MRGNSKARKRLLSALEDYLFLRYLMAAMHLWDLERYHRLHVSYIFVVSWQCLRTAH